MDIGSSSVNVGEKGKKSDKTRRVWSTREEEALLQALKDAVTGGWKSENGFKCGYLKFLENSMKKVLPYTNLQGIPHINSKIHVWKRNHGTLMIMLSRSGIGWNEIEKMIEATDEAWEAFAQGDGSVRTMRHKQWPYYHDWCEIFGNDRATGECVENFTQAMQDVLKMSDNLVQDVVVEMDDIFRDVEGAGESISVSNLPLNDSATKQTATKKRKKEIQSEDQFVSAMNKFTEMTDSTMTKLAQRIGYNYEMLNARNAVFDALGSVPELTFDETVDAAELLEEKHERLTLFFSLPEKGRLRMVRKLLK